MKIHETSWPANVCRRGLVTMIGPDKLKCKLKNHKANSQMPNQPAGHAAGGATFCKSQKKTRKVFRNFFAMTYLTAPPRGVDRC